MQELQARVSQLRGSDVRSRGGVGAPSAEFESLVAEWKPESMPGTIGGNVPFNPFGGGAKVETNGLKPLIEQAAANHGLDAKLLEALVSAESGFDPRARSRAGAMGLTQLMPGTARELGVTDPFDPVQNLNGGAKYLAKMLERFGSTELALAAYNAGPGRVEQAGNQIPNFTETKNYVRKVMAQYEGGA
jgi:soluble lytic murein transglycosylase-like protein